jgi:hypothetical protein
MEASLLRDKQDLDYLARKANSNNIKSLELQLIKVKSNMLNENMASKELKLKDVRNTLEEVLVESRKVKKIQDKKKGPAPIKTGQKAEEASPSDEPNPSPAE